MGLELERIKRATDPEISCSKLAIIERIKILNSRISGIDRYFPQGHELCFSKPIVILYGENGAGKTGFLKMLCESLRNEEFFRKNNVSWFLDEIFQNSALAGAFRNNKLAGKADINSFLYEHRSDFALLRYLEEIDPASSARLRKGQFKFTPAVFKKLCNSLRHPTPLNRYFYISLDLTDGQPAYPLYQEVLAPQSNGIKSPQNTGLPGSFDRTFDGESIPGSNLDNMRLRLSLGIPLDQVNLRSKEINSIRDYKAKALSAGQLAQDRWGQTKQAIQWALEQGYLMLPEIKTIDPVNFSRKAPFRRCDLEPNCRLVVILDEPTEHMDFHAVDKFAAELSALSEAYPGRLQFFISSSNYQLLVRLNKTADFLDCFKRPALSRDSFTY